MAHVFDPGFIESRATIRTLATLLGLGTFLMGLTIAVLSPASGLAWFVALWGWPWLYGSILALGGGLTYLGARIIEPRVAVVGAGVCVVWYSLFAAGFVFQVVLWWWGGQEGPQPALYPAWQYLLMASVYSLLLDVLTAAVRVDRLRRG